MDRDSYVNSPHENAFVILVRQPNEFLSVLIDEGGKEHVKRSDLRPREEMVDSIGKRKTNMLIVNLIGRRYTANGISGTKVAHTGRKS